MSGLILGSVVRRPFCPADSSSSDTNGKAAESKDVVVNEEQQLQEKLLP